MYTVFAAVTIRAYVPVLREVRRLFEKTEWSSDIKTTAIFVILNINKVVIDNPLSKKITYKLSPHVFTKY